MNGHVHALSPPPPFEQRGLSRIYIGVGAVHLVIYDKLGLGLKIYMARFADSTKLFNMVKIQASSFERYCLDGPQNGSLRFSVSTHKLINTGAKNPNFTPLLMRLKFAGD